MFADDFVSALSALKGVGIGSDMVPASGVSISSNIVPSATAIQADIKALTSWLRSLDEGTRQAIEEATADNPIKAGLADPKVGIVTSIGPILAAFDSHPSSQSIGIVGGLIAEAWEQAILKNPDTPFNA